MAVLRTRLRQIVGASLHVGERRRRRIPARNAVEPAAPFVRLATPRRLNRAHGPLEQRSARRREEILVEERHLVVAGVALGADEPGGRVDRQPSAASSPRADRWPSARRRGRWARRVRHRTPTVVSRLVGVVEADRSVSDDEHERREAIANPMSSMTRRTISAISRTVNPECFPMGGARPGDPAAGGFAWR